MASLFYASSIKIKSLSLHEHRRFLPCPPPTTIRRRSQSLHPSSSPLLYCHRHDDDALLESEKSTRSHGHHCGSCHHHHHQNDDDGNLTNAQLALLRFARAIRWAQLSDFLREHLRLCCCSMALLLAAAASPYVLPQHAVRPFHHAAISLAFPLVGVSSAFDAAMTIAAGKVNIHVLMALAAFASIFMGNSLEGALLLAMFNLSHIAEEYFTSKSMVDVKELKETHPEFALVLDEPCDELLNFSEMKCRKVSVHQVRVGSYILVRAGEAVPVDGNVYQGASTITVEHLTGEAKPLERKVGDSIPGGARNLEGMMIVKVAKSWEDSTLKRIVTLTEEGQLNKPKLQRWLDEFGEQYSRFVMILSLSIALLGPLVFKWPLLGNSASRGSIYRALGLMVAASPCALAVAPLAYATAISSCARKGILLRGANVLDALASCRAIAFDKTGTLTTGKLICKAIEPIHGHSAEGGDSEDPGCTHDRKHEALAVAAAMERGTTHPIGRAVLDHSVGKELPNVSVESFECLPGRGLFATLTSVQSRIFGDETMKASLGSVEYIASLCKSDYESERLKDAVKMSVYGDNFVQAALSVNEKVTLFHFEDEPRAGVENVVSALKDKGKFRVMMLTGDHESSAQRVAKAVGIDEVHYSLKPEDKLNHVRNTSRNTGGGGLVMVGDGINDAPALAAATVGIVLAQRASATAIAVADVLLLQDNISSIPFCIAKARQTVSLVKQSVALALSCIFLAALPSVMGFLPLWLTVLLHEGGTLLVCLNSIRALNNPTWSLKEAMQKLLGELLASFSALIERNWRPPPPSSNTATIQAASL